MKQNRHIRFTKKSSHVISVNSWRDGFESIGKFNGGNDSGNVSAQFYLWISLHNAVSFFSSRKCFRRFVSRTLRCTACIDHETSFFITVNHATVARISNRRAQQNPENSMKYLLLLLLLLFIFIYFYLIFFLSKLWRFRSLSISRNHG